MTDDNKTELLAPAGSMDALIKAVHNGADAVYLGGKSFSARAYAGNFDNDELKKAVDYAHLYDVRIYITANILIFQEELADFMAYADYLASVGVDGIIIQDIGAIDYLTQTYPTLEIHGSTQLHTTNEYAVSFCKNIGLSRVVLARELTTDQIKNIDINDIGLEVFAHGALCFSYSGQCLFSSFNKNRSGNRGECAQNCRMKYSLIRFDGKHEITDVRNKYLLSPKDVMTVSQIDEILDLNVDAIKLEGRMKPAEYVGFITGLYRRAMNSYYNNSYYDMSENDIETLNRLFNRGYSGGHILKSTSDNLMSVDRPNHKGVYAGEVIEVTPSRIRIKLSATLNQGDGIKFDAADKGMICNKIFINKKLTNRGLAGDIISLDNKVGLKNTDIVMITYDSQLNKELSKHVDKKIPIKLSAEFKLGYPGKLTLQDNHDNMVEVKGKTVEASRKSPMTYQRVYENLTKFGSTPYEAIETNIDVDDDIFYAVSEINSLRRQAVDRLNSLRLANNEHHKHSIAKIHRTDIPEISGLSVLVRNRSQLDACLACSVDRIYTSDYALYKEFEYKIDNIYFKSDRSGKVYRDCSKILATEIGALNRYNLKSENIIGDHSLNASNSLTVKYLLNNHCDIVTLSNELNTNQVSDIQSEYLKTCGLIPNLEVMIYGHIELMMTNQCVIASSLGKQKYCNLCKYNDFYLDDISGNRYPIKTDESCNSFIYNSKCTDRFGELTEYIDIGIKNYRIEFLDEDADDCTLIISKIIEALG